MPDTFGDDSRAADFVIVPDVVGMPYLVAREMATGASVVLANPDPHGPPIGAIVWPNNPPVQSQRPEPGSVMHRWGSLQVWLSTNLEPDMARRPDDPPPSVDRAHATPEVEAETIETTSDSAAGESAL